MIEVILKDYLDEHLSVPVFFDYPSNASSDFVLIDKVGGGEQSHLVSSSFAFQSYSESKYGAIVLNEKVKKVVKGSIELMDISRVQLNSDYNFPDTLRKKPRYQAVFDINHY